MFAVALLCLFLGFSATFWTGCRAGDQAAPGRPALWSQHQEAGRAALARSEYAVAEQELRAALQAAEGAADQDRLAAETLRPLAQLLALQGRNAEAEALYLQLLAVQERVDGIQAPPVGLTLSELGALSRIRKDYARAESLLARSLSIQEHGLEPHDPQLAAALERLAELRRARGEFAQADSLSRWAMSRTLRAQAHQSYLKGQYPQAELLYQRCLAIQEKTLGQHPDLAQTLDNLARLLQKGNRDQEAAPLVERARRIRQVASPR